MFPMNSFANLFLARILVFLPRQLPCIPPLLSRASSLWPSRKIPRLPQSRVTSLCSSPKSSPRPHTFYDLVDNRSALLSNRRRLVNPKAPCNQRQRMAAFGRFASPAVDFCCQRALLRSTPYPRRNQRTQPIPPLPMPSSISRAFLWPIHIPPTTSDAMFLSSDS
jgi:hypothetical protein